MDNIEPGLIVGSTKVISAPNVKYDDETVIWEGQPSQILNTWNYFCCACAIVFSIYCLWMWHSELKTGYEYLTQIINWVCFSVVSLGVIVSAYSYLYVAHEKTIITKNKIQEEKGISRLFRKKKFCEISDIRDIQIPAPGIILGIFNLANIVIETNDDDQRVIQIRAIKDKDSLIGKLLPVWRELKQERRGYFADR